MLNSTVINYMNVFSKISILFFELASKNFFKYSISSFNHVYTLKYIWRIENK